MNYSTETFRDAATGLYWCEVRDLAAGRLLFASRLLERRRTVEDQAAEWIAARVAARPEPPDLSHVYVGRMAPELRGRPCRILARWRGRGPHNSLVEFADGTRTICPHRCLRINRAAQTISARRTRLPAVAGRTRRVNR